MDPRLEHRRRSVAEDRARSNLGRLVRLLVGVAVIAGLVWLGQSPFLSLSEVVVRGASRVDVTSALASREVVTGRPMLLLDVDGAEAALLADPWVAEAEVARDWPTSLVVSVVERIPAASVLFSDGWWLVAADGTVLAATPQPTPDLGVARFEHMASAEAGDDLAVSGAVTFLDALPAERRPGVVVAPGADGLEAMVESFTVRLGGPFDMEEKAAVTLAVIDDGLVEGAIVTVVAPASPAVLEPDSETTTGGEEGGTTTTEP